MNVALYLAEAPVKVLGYCNNWRVQRGPTPERYVFIDYFNSIFLLLLKISEKLTTHQNLRDPILLWKKFHTTLAKTFPNLLNRFSRYII